MEDKEDLEILFSEFPQNEDVQIINVYFEEADQDINKAREILRKTNYYPFVGIGDPQSNQINTSV